MYDAGVLAEPPNGPTVLLVKFFEHGLKANFIVSKGLPDFLFSLKETNSQTCQTSRVNDFFLNHVGELHVHSLRTKKYNAKRTHAPYNANEGVTQTMS